MGHLIQKCCFLLVLMFTLTRCDEDQSDLHSLDSIHVTHDVIDGPGTLIQLPEPVQMHTIVEPAPDMLYPVKKEHYIKMTGKMHPHASGICSRGVSKGGWGYYPFPGTCNQYVHCDKSGDGFLETCAVGTFFDGRKCMRAEEVDCPFDPCRRMLPGEQYSDGQTCYGFYTCKLGRSMSGKCPSGFSFSAYKQGCWPDKTCIQASSLMHPCFAGTTLPYPGQPHLFYLWDGKDSVTQMECPRGLWYNPHVCTCDWIVPGQLAGKHVCSPMFHFNYDGHFLEAYNRAPQSPNEAVSLYKKSAVFNKGGQIVIWLMNDIDLGSQWALSFEFLTQAYGGEVALVSNDWKGSHFTYKITHDIVQKLVKGHFRMTDGSIVELIIMGVVIAVACHQPYRLHAVVIISRGRGLPRRSFYHRDKAVPPYIIVMVKAFVPHVLRVAQYGKVLKMQIDHMPPAHVLIDSGVMTSPSPMVIGAANGCDGFTGYFDELKFFRCVPGLFFHDYNDDE